MGKSNQTAQCFSLQQSGLGIITNDKLDMITSLFMTVKLIHPLLGKSTDPNIGIMKHRTEEILLVNEWQY